MTAETKYRLTDAERDMEDPRKRGERKDQCPCERKGAVDPWCHAAGMCVDEPEEPRT